MTKNVCWECDKIVPEPQPSPYGHDATCQSLGDPKLNPENSEKGVSTPPTTEYNNDKHTIPRRPKERTTTMAPRKTQSTEDLITENGDFDYTQYQEKELTEKQKDYIDWLEANVGLEIDERSAMVSLVLYPRFQASEFNRARTLERRESKAQEAEDRKAERAAAKAEKAAAQAAEAEPEDEAPAPAPKRGRKPAAAKPAAAKPATRGRPRGRKPASAAAPF